MAVSPPIISWVLKRRRGQSQFIIYKGSLRHRVEDSADELIGGGRRGGGWGGAGGGGGGQGWGVPTNKQDPGNTRNIVGGKVVQGGGKGKKEKKKKQKTSQEPSGRRQ